MSNRNHNLNNNGTDNEQKAPGKVKEKFITVNWRAGAKKLGKFAVGFCALAGAVGVGSYAAGRLGASQQITSTPDQQADVKLTDV